MTIYDDLAVITTGVMKQFKQDPVTLTRKVVTPDAVEPWKVGSTVTNVYTLYATVSGVNKRLVNDSSILASDLVVVSPVKCLLGTTEVDMPDIEPLTDVLKINGRSHDIKQVEKKPANGVTVAYLIRVAG